MRKVGILLLVLILLTSWTVSYANMEEKIDNHWSKGSINKSFLSYYFPYLAKDNFKKFDPNGTITRDEFNLSVASLFKDYEFDVQATDNTGNLTRKAMTSSLGNKLLSIGIKNEENTVLPFRDINTMDESSIELLRLLYSNGIIRGDSNSIFAPNRNLSQAESIIILQRVKGVLDDMNNIPFETVGVIQSFNNQEEIVTTQDKNQVLVTVTKEFPTPGYDMSVSRITNENNGKKIQFNIKPPAPDSVQLQVITYKTITIAIDKKYIGDAPYNFILDGYNKVTNKDAL